MYTAPYFRGVTFTAPRPAVQTTRRVRLQWHDVAARAALGVLLLGAALLAAVPLFADPAALQAGLTSAAGEFAGVAADSVPSIAGVGGGL